MIRILALAVLLFPLFVLVGIFQELSLRSKYTWNLRNSMIFSVITWGTSLVVITESLGMLIRIQKKPLMMAWWVLLVALFATYIFLLIKNNRIKKIFQLGWHPYSPTNLRDNSFIILSLGSIIVVISILTFIAYVYPPTNFDSMTYHLARIMHWQQNQSITPYATAITRQIQLQPLAEFITLNIIELTGGDRFVNFVQWTAFIICLIGVSNITASLGGSTFQQLIASLLCCSIPMALLQATSTQNDLVAAACLVCFINVGILLVRSPGIFFALMVGLALGLAVFTKATNFIFALPFCVIIAVMLIKKTSFKGLVYGMVIGSMLLFINQGHFYRMFQVYGSFLGPISNYKNETISINGLSANIIRNVALNYLPPKKPALNEINFNGSILSGLEFLHRFTGLAPNDSDTVWAQSYNVFKQTYRGGEDTVGNPLHFVLIVLSIIFLAIEVVKKRAISDVFILSIALVSSFILFCLLIKWQPWGNRLMLPLFILWTPVISLVLFRSTNIVILAIPILMIVANYNFLLMNPSRPLVPAKFTEERKALMSGNYEAFSIYRDISSQVSTNRCNDIGLIIGKDTWEYPLWIFLKAAHFNGRIEHIQVTNETTKFSDPNFKPCAVIAEFPCRGDCENWPQNKIGKYTLYLEPSK